MSDTDSGSGRRPWIPSKKDVYLGLSFAALVMGGLIVQLNFQLPTWVARGLAALFLFAGIFGLFSNKIESRAIRWFVGSGTVLAIIASVLFARDIEPDPADVAEPSGQTASSSASVLPSASVDVSASISPPRNGPTQLSSGCSPQALRSMAPKNLASPSQTTSSIDLSWSAPSAPGCPVKNYEVRRTGYVVGTTTETFFTISDLPAGAGITFIVVAHVGEVETPPAVIFIRTRTVGDMQVSLTPESVSPGGFMDLRLSNLDYPYEPPKTTVNVYVDNDQTGLIGVPRLEQINDQVYFRINLNSDSTVTLNSGSRLQLTGGPHRLIFVINECVNRTCRAEKEFVITS